MLSPAVQLRLERAREQENDYQPAASIQQAIGNRALVMVVAPAASGKTTVMQLAELMDHDFARVPVFSTRTARADDEPGMFRLSPHDDEHVRQLLDKIDKRKVIQYAIHPTQGTIYGTEASDYSAPFNLLATLSSVVEGLRRLPFQRTTTIGMITDAASWQGWFNDRFPEGNPDRPKRLKEASQSLEWLLADNQVQWLYNHPDIPEQTAHDMIELVKGNRTPTDLRPQAEKLLNTVHELVG